MATVEDLKKWEEARNAKLSKYNKNDAYMRGKNPTIIGKEPGKEPDNRIPIPWAKSAVEDMAGYAASPGNITVEYPREDGAKEEPNEYEALVRQWEKRNNDNLEITELYIEQLAHGRSYELWWTDVGTNGTEAIPRWKRVPGKDVVPLYDDSFEPKMSGAVYFWEGKDKSLNALYLQPAVAEGWTKPENKEWRRNDEHDMSYPYKSVPMLEFYGDMHKEVFFESQKEMIDAHDKLISASQNEVDRFNALIALFPGPVTQEFVEKLVELRVIDNLDEYDAQKWPQYLQKQMGGIDGFYDWLADRLERLFHKTIKVPDTTSPEFSGGDESGVARAFKLLPMEFKATMIDAYFNKGLVARKTLIDDVIEYNTGSEVNPQEYTARVNNKRNVPVDEATKVQIAIMLKGIVSDETILRMLPGTIVADVAEELARIDAQRRVDPFGDDDADIDLGDGTTAETGDVQRQALNGAQISSIVEIAAQVANKELPLETAVEILLVSIPSLDEQTAREIMGPAAVFEPRNNDE